MEHAGQARLRLNLAATSALSFLHPYLEQINSDRPELSSGAPGCWCWALEYSGLQGNLTWATQRCGTTTPFNAQPCLKMLGSSVQRPRQLCRTELLSSGLMPVMPDPANSINNNPAMPVFPFSCSALQESLLAGSRSGPDLAVCSYLAVINPLKTQPVAKRESRPQCGPSGARKHLGPLQTFLVSSE